MSSYHWPWRRCPLRGDTAWRNVAIPAAWFTRPVEYPRPEGCHPGSRNHRSRYLRCRRCWIAFQDAAARYKAFIERGMARAWTERCKHGVLTCEPCPACSRAWLLELETAELRREARMALDQGEAAIVLLAMRWKALGYRQGLFGE